MSTCSNADFPFSFLDTSGDGFVNGTLFEGSCIFPDANCNADTPIKNCCGLNLDVIDYPRVYLMQVANVWCWIPVLLGVRVLMKMMTEEEKVQYEKEEEERKPKFPAWVPSWMKWILLEIWECGLTAFMVGSAMVPIYLKTSEQAYMSVTERTSLAASEAFMVPFYIIFTFVEDIIMVRVAYSIGQNNKELTNKLIHIGLAGVIFTGVLAGLFGTILGVFDTSLKFLTIPGLSNDQALYPGCSFIEDVDSSMIFPYWMLESWGLVGKQIGGVLSGFLMGSMEYDILGWIGSIGLGVFCLIWFGNIETFPNLITLLGISEFAKDWVTTLLLLGLLLSPLGKRIAERTGLELSVKKVFSYFLAPFQKKSNVNGEEETEQSEDNGGVLQQGLKIMCIDITIQSCLTCSTYLALNADSAVAYQLTALQSELPQYGLGYAVGMSIAIKMMGPMFLSQGKPKAFSTFVMWNLAAVFFLVVLIIGLTVPSLDGLTVVSGLNACAFASSSECLPYFNKVFGKNGEGGPYTLFFTYYVFPAAASLDCIMLILRAILMTCLDFDFMVLATLVAGCSYIPTIAVVQYGGFGFEEQAIGYFAAAYVPIIVLVLCFGGRSGMILHKISNGETGPWTQSQSKRVSVVPSSDEGNPRKIEAADDEQSA